MDKTKYTTRTYNLNPNFVTGFCDAESCFTLIISKNPKHTLGWSVKLVFNIPLHGKELESLYLIQRLFGVGNRFLPPNLEPHQTRQRKIERVNCFSNLLVLFIYISSQSWYKLNSEKKNTTIFMDSINPYFC